MSVIERILVGLAWTCSSGVTFVWCHFLCRDPDCECVSSSVTSGVAGVRKTSGGAPCRPARHGAGGSGHQRQAVHEVFVSSRSTGQWSNRR